MTAQSAGTMLTEVVGELVADIRDRRAAALADEPDALLLAEHVRHVAVGAADPTAYDSVVRYAEAAARDALVGLDDLLAALRSGPGS